MKKSGSPIEEELVSYLGEDNFFMLVENFAGTRLYIPNLHYENVTQVENILGRNAAEILSRYYGGTCLKVPLSRERRAGRYRQKGMSYRQISLKLGMTEAGVERLFNRLRQSA